MVEGLANTVTVVRFTAARWGLNCEGCLLQSEEVGRLSESGYILKNADAAASTRLDVLASIFDPWTWAHLDALGLSAGWRCWEVGAGGPNTVRWLAQRVGPTGYVLATDLDPRWAAAAVGENVSVLAHDIADAPPEAGFDLVHARLVLTHVPERERALSNLAGALRPGG